MTRFTAARTVAMVGAVVGWAALVLQLVLLLDVFQSEGGTWLGGVWRFLGFFTILANILTAVVLTHAAARPRVTSGLGSPRVEFAMTTSMALVGITYSLLLRALWEPQGWQKVADVVLHDVMPIMAVVFFLLRGHAALRWQDAPYAIILPVCYGVYALARGAADGWYAYPFLDPNKLSAAQMTLNMVGLTLGVLALTLVLLVLAKAVATTHPNP